MLSASCLSLSSRRGFAPRSVGADGFPNENHAASYPDNNVDQYAESLRSGPGGIVMDYRFGDRFRLRQPMFLVYTRQRIVYLCEVVDSDVPNLAEYKKNPHAYSYGSGNRYQVIRLVPAGTVIRVVKIADVDTVTIPYFVFEGENDWFRCAAFASNRNLEYNARRKVILKSYDKELFRKL